ncbi:MAG: hypothetical protein CM15mP98_04780 [Paracoccaceae bacterium]|nr:MAG: hypothetical protein CM15mP98_04780 [Paracoccaceae bacterium]
MKVHKSLFGFDSIVGSMQVQKHRDQLGLLHHVFGEIDGEKGAWGHAVGGMGSITLMKDVVKQKVWKFLRILLLKSSYPKIIKQ